MSQVIQTGTIVVAKANITLFNCDELFPEINLPCSNPLRGGAVRPLGTMGDYSPLWQILSITTNRFNRLVTRRLKTAWEAVGPQKFRSNVVQKHRNPHFICD
jgi:hypothetical protein